MPEVVDYGQSRMRKGREGFVLAWAVAIAGLVACSNTGVPAGSDAGPPLTCGTAPAVEDTSLQACLDCTPASPCTQAEPLSACCVWVAQPRDALADGIGLHRYSTPDPSATPDLACLTQPATLGTPQTATLTGYVSLFSSGQDSQGVEVDVFPENHPQIPDGSIGNAPLGAYTTTGDDPIDPVDTSWNMKCPNGCSYRQYTIQNVPTETPLVQRTRDAGSGAWATAYEYNVYLRNADVEDGQVRYDATAVAAPDPSILAGALGLTWRTAWACSSARCTTAATSASSQRRSRRDRRKPTRVR